MKILFFIIFALTLAGCVTPPKGTSAPTASTAALGNRIEGMAGHVSKIDDKAVIVTERNATARSLSERIDYKAAILEDWK